MDRKLEERLQEKLDQLKNPISRNPSVLMVAVHLI